MTAPAGSRVFWASTWAVGVALGTAAGAWLSVVGASGAPGAQGLDVVSELLVVPALAGILVFLGYLALAYVAGRRRDDSAVAQTEPPHGGPGEAPPSA